MDLGMTVADAEDEGSEDSLSLTSVRKVPSGSRVSTRCAIGRQTTVAHYPISGVLHCGRSALIPHIRFGAWYDFFDTPSTVRFRISKQNLRLKVIITIFYLLYLGLAKLMVLSKQKVSLLCPLDYFYLTCIFTRFP